MKFLKHVLRTTAAATVVGTIVAASAVAVLYFAQGSDFILFR